jgi:hypothetical protein
VFSLCLTRLISVAAIGPMLVLFNSPLYAEAFDPTRPPVLNAKPRSAPVVKLPKLNPQDYQVTSILSSDQRKVAVINNQVVTVGDVVKAGQSDKATVKKINTTEVTLSKARREFVVRLPSSQYLRPVVSGHTQGMKDQP